MKTRAVRVLAALTLVLGLFGFAPAVQADLQCAHTSVTLYEGFNRTGDARTFCGNVNDLNGAVHTQAGNCDSHPLGDNSWDDCASSWYVGQNDHHYCIQIFSNPSGPLEWPLLEGGFRNAGYWSNFDSGEDNKASSIKWTSTSICGSNG